MPAWRVGLRPPDFPWRVFARRLDQFPVCHLGLATALAVNRPTGSMVVRRAFPGARVGMREDTEAEFRVLIKDFALWHIVAKMRCDELLVLQYLLEECTHLLPTGRPGSALRIR